MLSSFLPRVGIRAGDCSRCQTIHCPSPEKYTLSLHSQCRCNTAVKCSPDGGILSTKYSGEGLVTKSVKIIAEKYGGVCRFESANGMFRASVLCPILQKIRPLPEKRFLFFVRKASSKPFVKFRLNLRNLLHLRQADDFIAHDDHVGIAERTKIFHRIFPDNNHFRHFSLFD